MGVKTTLAPLALLASMLGSCSGSIDGPNDSFTPSGAGPLPFRRLNRIEYTNTLRDLLKEFDVDASIAAGSLPSDAKASSGFLVGGSVDTNDASRLMEVAELVGSRVADRLTERPTCDSVALGEEACARKFIERFGRRAYRRPLETGEVDELQAHYTQVRAELTLGHAEALQVLFQAMLQSPNFLYRWELGPTTALARGAGAAVTLNPHELASRLSYFLWGTMPDDALFAAADSGQLTTPAQVAAQARRMLGDPKARDAIANFHLEWLGIDNLEGIQKGAAFPQWDAELKLDLQKETYLFVNEVVFGEGNGRLAALFSAPFTFASEKQASIYGLEGVTGRELRRVLLPPGKRSGILTQVAFLAKNATGSESHPVRRGVTVLEKVLCTHLPVAPDVLPEVKPASADVTTRERFAEHSSNSCARGCHDRIDPLGFSFEHYDAVGRFRTRDGDKEVDASSTVSFPSGEVQKFQNAFELASALAISPDVRSCMVRQWLRYALGRAEVPEDQRSIDVALADFQAADYDIRELLVSITGTPSFLVRSQSLGEVLP
ncbi:MAG TPA: DUF1592 domain-containing protein [Myxococcaceae bacterium]|nr:DUF1592 domain-containing protein [Myxococcaceae bacterium]